MSLNCDINHFLNEKDWLVWVLAPYLETDDPNLQYYYDFSQSIQEYTQVFADLNLDWKWQNLTLDNYDSIVRNIRDASFPKLPLILNLCDGDEANGVPGLSVVKLLETLKLIYTGSDPYFYEITTSKIPMKKLFDQYKVPTPNWMIINPRKPETETIFSKLTAPLIVKPAISAGSLGLGLNAVVSDAESFTSYINNLLEGYKGWDFVNGGLFVEEFIDGEEFTTLIVGSEVHRQESKIYKPVERLFDESLPANEKFLSFDRLWEIYENEAPLKDEKALWHYHVPDPSLISRIQEISWKAYCAVKGTGYGRIDLRRNKKTGELYVLEVNAQCGLSEDENYTSIGAILRYEKTKFSTLIKEVLYDAYLRHAENSIL
ncbi:MAG: hypothetical protein JNL65_01145 [Saprospiraceae bacterium]|nr:hypothetical protein [Saprospiraceae bacterium]HRG68068.1 hypothetical protein [Saprospiraceae bacterium]